MATYMAPLSDGLGARGLDAQPRPSRAVRQGWEYLQFIADSAATSIAHCSADRLFLFVNKAYAARLGLTPDRIIGRSIAEVLGEEVAGLIDPYVERVLAGEAFEYEIEVPYQEVGPHYVHCAYTPEVDADGRVVGWVAAVTDMTERHRAEVQLRQAEESLREADRRKDEFLATLAHELRNPLAPIRNAVQILRMKGPPDPELRWAREVIDRQAQQLTHLVDDLLDVSRITRGRIELRKERLEVAALVERALETSRPLIEASRHRLTVNYPEGSLCVVGDLTRLAQVLSNLLNNAAKYTAAGGRLEISVAREDLHAVIRVRDDGIGIPPEMLSRIFEMFAQVDTSLERAQGGLGIGLTVARRLVELHGGTVAAASDGPGRGSELTVRLPLAQETAAPAEGEREPDGAAGARRPLRILVVDDNRDSADSLALLLEIKGHDVRTAHDGPQALVLAGELRPQVVLLDIGMPGMSGYEVARRLRAQPATAGAVLVAMTGWGQDEDRRRSKEAGFDHHLVKPIDPATLDDLLARLASGKA